MSHAKPRFHNTHPVTGLSPLLLPSSLCAELFFLSLSHLNKDSRITRGQDREVPLLVIVRWSSGYWAILERDYIDKT